MSNPKQVNKSHYNFKEYVTKERWASIWHQLDELISISPKEVLEIGAGTGILKELASLFEIKIKTIDIDPELNPDYIGSVLDLPFLNDTFELVCAFQVLEHLPYDDSLMAFREMVRVSNKYVIISLPDSRDVFQYLFHIPKVGVKKLLIPKISLSEKEHIFDGEHYWEIGKKNFKLNKVVGDLGKLCKLQRSFRVFENPYHHFFIFAK